jgi:parvulin-like peptidyl-prolyl isomerase
MLKTFSISQAEIIHQIKLSCQVPTLIEGIIARKIIASTAQELGIQVETEELQQAADRIRLLNRLEKSEDTWSWLQKHYLSLDEFEESIYASTLATKLAQHLFGDRVELFFAERILDYTQAVLYEVVLDDEDLTIELFYALQEEELTFPEVAHQYIQEPELRRVGGYRGTLRRSELKPEISAAVFVAKPPQILKPIKTSRGIHLIMVEAIIHPKLDTNLSYKILNDLFSAWLKQQIEQVETICQVSNYSQ